MITKAFAVYVYLYVSGCGGNVVHMAGICDHLLAIDTEPAKLEATRYPTAMYMEYVLHI